VVLRQLYPGRRQGRGRRQEGHRLVRLGLVRHACRPVDPRCSADR
jgi:hypothetical protein